MQCEKLDKHCHPLIKFKTPKHFQNFTKDLLNKYPYLLDIEENQEVPIEKVNISKEEEDKENPLDMTKPRIIDNLDFDDLEKYDVYSDDLLNQCKVL